MTAPQTQEPEMVKVNLVEIIDSVTRAGKAFTEIAGRADIQAILVGDRDLASVYMSAAEEARKLFDKGENLELANFNREWFDMGYQGLMNGQIQVLYHPTK